LLWFSALRIMTWCSNIPNAVGIRFQKLLRSACYCTELVYNSVPVLKAAGNHNLDILASPEGLKCLLPNNSTKNDYEIEQHILENIEAPVKKGDVLGYIEVKKDGVTIGKIDAVASRDVEKT